MKVKELFIDRPIWLLKIPRQEKNESIARFCDEERKLKEENNVWSQREEKMFC